MAASGAHAARHGLVGLSRGERPKFGPPFREGWYIVFVVFPLALLLLVTTRENLVPWLATALLRVLNQLFSPRRRGRRQLLAFLGDNGTGGAHVHHVVGHGVLHRAVSGTGCLCCRFDNQGRADETGLQAMKFGSSTHFVQFIFLVNPSQLLQGRLSDFARHASTALLAVARVYCGLRGCLIGVGDLRRCHAWEGRRARCRCSALRCSSRLGAG